MQGSLYITEFVRGCPEFLSEVAINRKDRNSIGSDTGMIYPLESFGQLQGQASNVPRQFPPAQPAIIQSNLQSSTIRRHHSYPKLRTGFHNFGKGENKTEARSQNSGAGMNQRKALLFLNIKPR
jgi:hypothetical protein